MGLGQILLFSWVRLEVIELYKCRVLQLLVVLGFFTKVDDSLLPRIFRPWLRIKKDRSFHFRARRLVSSGPHNRRPPGNLEQEGGFLSALSDFSGEAKN